jgi:hypothetical protein
MRPDAEAEMLIYPLTFLAIAALLGIYMVLRVFKGVMPPWPAAIFHGLFAATGLLILLYAAFLSATTQAQTVVIAAVLLVVAALGGLVLVSYHLRKQVPPKALAGVHALLAVAGFLVLAGATFGMI